MPRRIPPFLFRSVRGRLILLVAALIVPVVALAGTMIFQAYRNERTSVARTLLSTARAVARVVDGEIEQADSYLRTLAASSAMARDDFVAVESSARRVLANTWFDLAVFDVRGRELLNTGTAPSAIPALRTEVAPEVVAALERRAARVTKLAPAHEGGRPLVHIARGYFRDGTLKYILMLSITPEVLARKLDVDRYAPGKIVSVIDTDHRIVARNRNLDRFVGVAATGDMQKALAIQSEGIIDSVTLDGIAVVSAYSAANSGWTAIIAAPKSDLFASARRLLAWGISGTILLLLVAILMSAWIARALIRSSDILAADAEALARGELPEPVSSGLDESDFVARSMRRTAATLLRRTRTLEMLNRINSNLVAAHDVEKIVRSVTDAGRELSGAAFSVFFHRRQGAGTPADVVFTVSGDAPPAFARLDGETGRRLLERTFTGRGVVRVVDTRSEAWSQPEELSLVTSNEVRSYLAVPVRSRTDVVLGAMLFGHGAPGVFTQEAEDIVVGLAAEAAIAIDNAQLYHVLARELEAKSKAEAELRVAQQRLHEHARDLERKVAERTASLREAVTQMEEFSYTVSHDLRGPLRAMHAFADALMEDYAPQLDDTARDYLRRIQRAGRRMDALTTDLLSYSRVARAEVRLEPTDVEKIVRGTLEHYAELQPGTAEVRIETPLHPVLAHEPSLTQCIANLLTNAAKFVPPGEKPHIVVRTERISDRVRIWIIDQGIGIPPEYQATLFRIFERVPSKHGYEGTGIGLAIVRKASEKMSGTCGVVSDGVNGSRFWIELAAA